MSRRVYRKSSYLLPTHERIRLLENNIAVFEAEDCITMVKHLKAELERLEKGLVESA